jgi:hypothetical protein
MSSIGFLVSSGDGTFSGPPRTQIILTSAFSIVSQIGFAFPLLFKTEWIADSLKLKGSLQDSPSSLGESRLQPGITLLGIYIFCTKIGSLPQVYAASRRATQMTNPFAATQPKGLTFSPEYIEPVITLVVSLLLIFGSKYIAAFLEKRKINETEQEASLDRE